VFGALLVLPAHSWAGLTPEDPVSPNAEDSMTAYVVMGILATVLAIGVIAALIGAIRSREREEDAAPRRIRGTTTIQRGVGTVLASLTVLAFIFGVAVTEHASEVQPSTADGLDPSATAQTSLELPAGGSAPLEIDATAQQWLWRFEYPGGAFSYHELVVPVDTAVVLHLDSAGRFPPSAAPSTPCPAPRTRPGSAPTRPAPTRAAPPPSPAPATTR
jgi:heme/copper-type cytochrome/quinol oxidase subunit 2